MASVSRVRPKILEELTRAGERGATAAELTATIGCSPQRVWGLIAELRDAGALEDISGPDDGGSRRWRLREEVLNGGMIVPAAKSGEPRVKRTADAMGGTGAMGGGRRAGDRRVPGETHGSRRVPGLDEKLVVTGVRRIGGDGFEVELEGEDGDVRLHVVLE